MIMMEIPKKALAAQRKLKTIAGRLEREIERKLPASSLGKHSSEIENFLQILRLCFFYFLPGFIGGLY